MAKSQFAWALQSDYKTQVALAADVLKQLITTDDNLIDYAPATVNDEEWSNGFNGATDEWIETHDDNVSHTMPGFAQELGKPLILNLGDYAVTTPTGATAAKRHLFKPQDPDVSQQGRAVTYAERMSSGYNVLMPRAVANGFSLKGNALGVLTMDFGLKGAGKLIVNSGTIWKGAGKHVVPVTGLHKLFNTQVGLVVTDGGTATTYGCRYKSFSIDYGMTLKEAAGYSPGCAEYQIDGDQTSGAIRSELEFDKQSLTFTFNVKMATGSPELLAVQQQKPLVIALTATGGIIEGLIRHQLIVSIPVAKYTASKPVRVDGQEQFQITGRGLFDYGTNQLFQVELITNVPSFATGW